MKIVAKEWKGKSVDAFVNFLKENDLLNDNWTHSWNNSTAEIRILVSMKSNAQAFEGGKIDKIILKDFKVIWK